MFSSLYQKILFPILLIAMASLMALYAFSVPFIRHASHRQEEESARAILDNFYNYVNTLSSNMADYREHAMRHHKKEIKDVVLLAESLLAERLRQVEQGAISRAAAQRQACEEIRHLRYGNDDYLWIVDYDGKLLAHPDPQTNGRDFSQVRDVRGTLFVPQMVTAARREEKDGAYTSYWWTRLGARHPSRKLAYSKDFPPWHWVIGSGVYLDDIDSELAARQQNFLSRLKKQIDATRIARTGYFYIFDGHKRMILHPNHDLEQTDFSAMIDSLTGKPLVDELIAASRRPDNALYYKWDKPDDRNHFVYDKISWVRHIEGLDWYVASSVYREEINSSADRLSRRIIVVSALVFLLLLATISLVVRQLLRPVRDLAATAGRIANGDLGARSRIRQRDEIGLLAAAFNDMVERLQQNIATLDIRVRQRTEELEKANAELRLLDRLKSQFLSNVSHELRTPLTSIRGFGQLVRKDFNRYFLPWAETDPTLAKKAPRIDANLAIILQEVDHLTRLINDVLDLTHIESGRMAWHDTPLDVAGLIDGAVAAVAGLLADKPAVRLEVLIAENLPKLFADQERLRQVLENLLANAVKFTDHGAVELTAGVAETTGQLRITVRDTGRGIAAHELGRIFDHFHQTSDDGLEDKPQGTGLGLAICRRIVDHYGGAIDVESVPGQGSVFTVLLPFAGGR